MDVVENNHLPTRRVKYMVRGESQEILDFFKSSLFNNENGFKSLFHLRTSEHSSWSGSPVFVFGASRNKSLP